MPQRLLEGKNSLLHFIKYVLYYRYWDTRWAKLIFNPNHSKGITRSGELCYAPVAPDGNLG